MTPIPHSSDEAAALSQGGLPIGSLVAGKYRVDGILGTGGMGVVLSATNLDLDAPVAIKVVRDANNEEVVSRLVQEARCAAKMHGAHMVRILDVARLETGAPYIVMERLEGSDLATLLGDRGALPIQEAVGYVLEACEGLAEAHALGIVHRDLKPENLFLAVTPEGVVLKILDFGISKDLGCTGRPGPRTALTNAGCAVGSPYYMSPEQMRASPHVDARADIWSLGAVLFELLTGKCPFEGESVQVVCVNVLSLDAPSLRGFSEDAPEELDAIVRRCLEKAPDARFQSVTELATALRHFVSADSQRLAGRRVASGISLVPKCPPPPEPRSLAIVGSSPTLQSRSYTPGTAATRFDSELTCPEPPVKRRALPFVTAALALALAAGAFMFWQSTHALDSGSPPQGVQASAVGVAPVSTQSKASAPTALAAPTAPPAETAKPGTVLVNEHVERAPTAAPVRPRPSRIAVARAPAPKPDPAPARSKALAPAASAAFDDLQSSGTSGSPPSVNAWDVDKLGGRY